MPGIYDQVRTLRPGRSAFNLSYEKKLTCDLGQLIPIMADEVIPGDTWKIGVEAVVRMMPMVAPILHEINIYFHYYFVPYRLLDANWENFITGGVDGQDAHTMPRWQPTGGNITNDNGDIVADNGVGSLWDYFGFPVGVIPDGAYPLAWPRLAYNLVYNQYYRDETLQTEILMSDGIVKQRSWHKDFFTSAMPWQQRGVAPALPVTITGSSKALWPDFLGGGNTNFVFHTPAANVPADAGTKAALELNTVSLASASATTFNVSDLRLAFQIQKWMERNARGGARYVEWLQNHFGVFPRDDRLQRAEYIGGTKMPVIMSEVLQTSQTGTTPQGNMAGHGLGAGRDFCASYSAKEFGIIIGIMSLMPTAVYQQGINRQWLRTTRYDYYSPEFAHLSEQAVQRCELYASNSSASNTTIFGYQGRHNELRSKQSMCCGLMRSGVSGSLAFWHLARNFASAPALNSSFVMCIPRKDYLAVPSQPACIVNIANVIKAIRPLPIESDPGLIDH